MIDVNYHIISTRSCISRSQFKNDITCRIYLSVDMVMWVLAGLYDAVFDTTGVFNIKLEVSGQLQLLAQVQKNT